MGQSPEILKDTADSVLLSDPQLAGMDSLEIFDEASLITNAATPEACVVTDHPAVLLFGALIAICGFGLLAYGFMF